MDCSESSLAFDKASSHRIVDLSSLEVAAGCIGDATDDSLTGIPFSIVVLPDLALRL